MDFNLKQWRHHQQEQQQQTYESEEEEQHSAKIPKLLLNSYHHHHHQQQPPAAAASPVPALPLFVPNPTSTTHLSPSPYASDNSTTKPTCMGIYFSLTQRQEFELQALIFKYMLAGAAVPSELLHLLKKTLINTPSYYLSHHPVHPYYPHYQPVLQSGYWGKGAMDPEPGRCRRTDGKKWRCSRDVVAGQKYCERHVHRGRNRSRKPVEIPTSTSTTTATPYGCKDNGNGGGEVLKSVTNAVARAATGGGGGGGTVPFSLSGPSPSMDLLHFNQRPTEPTVETRGPFEAQNNGERTLRPFFDDWPRSLQDSENATSSMTLATNLSISTGTGNPSSDFSLRLSTGDDGDDSATRVIGSDRDRLPPLHWGAQWGSNQVSSMGGPLAEALRSSTSNSSPTSVLHQLPRASASEVNYVGT